MSSENDVGVKRLIETAAHRGELHTVSMQAITHLDSRNLRRDVVHYRPGKLSGRRGRIPLGREELIPDERDEGGLIENRTRFDHNFVGVWLRCTQAVVLNQKFYVRYGMSDVVSETWDWRVVCLLQNWKYWRFS